MKAASHKLESGYFLLLIEVVRPGVWTVLTSGGGVKPPQTQTSPGAAGTADQTYNLPPSSLLSPLSSSQFVSSLRQAGTNTTGENFRKWINKYLLLYKKWKDCAEN